jgi:uncharacterized membrane protein YkoI
MTIKALILACALGAAGAPAAASAQGVWGGLGLERPQSSLDSLGAGWRADQQAEARDRVRGGDILPLPRVLGEVRRRAPGRLLDAGLEDQGGRPVYRIRWAAQDGRRIDFLVDARTGAILRADGA